MENLGEFKGPGGNFYGPESLLGSGSVILSLEASRLREKVNGDVLCIGCLIAFSTFFLPKMVEYFTFL